MQARSGPSTETMLLKLCRSRSNWEVNAGQMTFEDRNHAGMNDRILKPIERATLLKAVHRWIPG